MDTTPQLTPAGRPHTPLPTPDHPCMFLPSPARSTWSRTACSCLLFISLMYQATQVMV